MSKIAILLSFCLILSVISENCGTPIECYLQAIDLLTRDREGIRIAIEKFEASQRAFEEKVLEQIKQSMASQHAFEEKVLEQIKQSMASQHAFEEKLEKLEEKIKQSETVKENRNYMFREAIIYQNIFEALEKDVIAKLGNPNGWEEIIYRDNVWNHRHMLRIGVNPQTNGNGLKVNVPEGYDIMWLRVTNDRWNVFRVNSLEFTEDILEKYDCNRRGLNEISPDGTTSDSYDYLHKWCPIPLHKKGSYVVYTDVNTDGWISGIAFSKNIWKMAKNGALAYHWKINGGTGVTWVSDNWNGDVLAKIEPGRVTELFVPVIPSGNDKLLYIVEHNNNWDGLMHTSILVNDMPVERLRTTYQNAFSYHINSKVYSRYVAVIVPKNLIPENAKFLKVTINMTNNNNGIFFREIGTHDYIE